MHHKSPIRPLLGGLLLLVFAFSITPKLYLHALFADHEDIAYARSSTSPEIGTAGFHCDCDNQVVELPFIDTHIAGIEPIDLWLFRTFQTRAEHQFQSFPHFILGLRGPPFLI